MMYFIMIPLDVWETSQIQQEEPLCVLPDALGIVFSDSCRKINFCQLCLHETDIHQNKAIDCLIEVVQLGIICP